MNLGIQIQEIRNLGIQIQEIWNLGIQIQEIMIFDDFYEFSIHFLIFVEFRNRHNF